MTTQNLADSIEFLGLSSNELARKMGVSQATISYWLSGKYPIPKQAEFKIGLLLYKEVNKQLPASLLPLIIKEEIAKEVDPK